MFGGLLCARILSSPSYGLLVLALPSFVPLQEREELVMCSGLRCPQGDVLSLMPVTGHGAEFLSVCLLDEGLRLDQPKAISQTW